MNKKTKVLIIEDNPADVALIEAYLKEASFKHQLFQAVSLSEGLELLREHQPDLVLLDLQLHDVEGFRTVQQFREKAPDMPVIVLTGFKNEVIGIQSVRAGAQDFLVKGDFDARSLVRTIRYSMQRFEAQYKLKEKAEQLSTSEKRNRLTHHIARFGRWEMDIVNYTMKWDDEIFRFFGFPPNSLTPSLSEYLKYVHVEDRQKVEAFFEKAVNDGQLHRLTHRIVLENTVVKFLRVNAKVSYDDNSNRLLLLGSVQDVTEQYPLQRNQGEMASSDTAGVSETLPGEVAPLSSSLLSFFALNLRTPAASLSNFLYLLKDSPLDEQQQRYVESMQEALDEFNFNLNNCTSVTDETEQQLAEVNLPALLHSFEQKARKRVKKSKVNLETTYSKKLPPTVLIDSEKLARVIFNLVETGANFSMPGTDINLSFGTKGKREKELLLLIRLQIQSSIFDPEEAARIIHDNTALKNQTMPSALYLPLPIAVHTIRIFGGSASHVQLSNHKYSIQAEIPLQAIPCTEQEAKSSTPPPLQILLAEDHDLHRLATQRILSQWAEGVQVTTAKNGAEAVEVSANSHFDIILMDLQMPVLNGIEATIKIRANSSTPIIALAVNDSKQEQEQCRMVGINDYLIKPVVPERLFSAILQQIPEAKKDFAS